MSHKPLQQYWMWPEVHVSHSRPLVSALTGQRSWPSQVALCTHDKTPPTASFCCDEVWVPDTAVPSATLATAVWFVDWGDVEGQRGGQWPNGGWDNGPSLIRDLKVAMRLIVMQVAVVQGEWKKKQKKQLTALLLWCPLCFNISPPGQDLPFSLVLSPLCPLHLLISYYLAILIRASVG